MPCRIIFLVKFLFDVGSNILRELLKEKIEFISVSLMIYLFSNRFYYSYFFDVIFFESLRSTVNSILLHIFSHISILNYSFSFGHFELRSKD